MANRKLKGFSLAELLIALLVISIVLAAAIPTMTRKGKGSEQIWKWSVDATPQSLANLNEPNTFRTNSAYFGTGANQSVFIGSKHDPLSYAKVEDYFPALDVDNNMDFTTLGDKLSLLKVGLQVDNPTVNTTDELTHFVNSHISFYNEPRITSTENETEYVGRIAMDQNNMAMGLGAMQSTLSEYTKTDTNERIIVKGNTSLGHYSLFWNDLGTYNTTVGYKALVRNIAGSKNTAIGARACSSLNGNYNICIGAKTGDDIDINEQNDANETKTGAKDISYRLLIAADKETAGANMDKDFEGIGGAPLIEGISAYNGYKDRNKAEPILAQNKVDSVTDFDANPTDQQKHLIINSRYFVVRPYNGLGSHAFKVTSDYFDKPVVIKGDEDTLSHNSDDAYTCYKKPCKLEKPTSSRMELRLFEPSDKNNITTMTNDSINFTVQQPLDYATSTKNYHKYLEEVGIYTGFFDRGQNPFPNNFFKPRTISFNDQLSFTFAKDNSANAVASIVPRNYKNSADEDDIYDLMINTAPTKEYKTINMYFANSPTNSGLIVSALTPDETETYYPLTIGNYGTNIMAPTDEKSYIAMTANNGGLRFDTPNRTEALVLQDDKFTIGGIPAPSTSGSPITFDAIEIKQGQIIFTNLYNNRKYNPIKINSYGLTLSNNKDEEVMRILPDYKSVIFPELEEYDSNGSLIAALQNLEEKLKTYAREVSYGSDIRLKNVSGDSTAGLKEINALEVKNYTYKADKNKTPHVGVIAQQLQKVFPNSVFEDKDGFLKIKTEEIFYAMVNSIKELTAKVQDLTAKIVGLDKRITELEKQNAELKKQNEEFEKRLEKLEKAIK